MVALSFREAKKSYSGHVTNYVNAHRFTDHSLIRLTTFHSRTTTTTTVGLLPFNLFPLASPVCGQHLRK